MLDAPSESTKSQYPFVSPNRSEEIKMTMVPKNIVRMRTSESIFRTTINASTESLKRISRPAKKKTVFKKRSFPSIFFSPSEVEDLFLVGKVHKRMNIESSPISKSTVFPSL